MTGHFEYGKSVSYLDSIEIENIGDCCIQAFNDMGEEYYLIVETRYGQTKVLEYGPFLGGAIPDFCYEKYSQFQYSENKIEKIIDKFLSSHELTQAVEIDMEDIENNLVDVKRYMSVWQ